MTPDRRRRHAAPALGVVTLAMLLAAMLVSASLGTGEIAIRDVLNVLAAHSGLPSAPVSPTTEAILWQLRVPRVISAAVFGAGLALCGGVLQALTRNPLAEPYLLGISSGASAGAVTVSLLGYASALGLSGGAMVGGAVSLALLLLLLRRTGLESTRVVLTGVVVSQLFSALTSLILMAAGDADSTRAITFWLLGSLGNARWDSALLGVAVTLTAMLVFIRHSRALDALSLGGDTAASLGVEVVRVRLGLLICVSIVTATTVAAVGAIGFVGLIVPHAMRFVVGPLNRALLPASATLGALLLVITDALCRVAFSPRELPVGVITALIGVPAFLVIMRKRGEL